MHDLYKEHYTSTNNNIMLLFFMASSLNHFCFLQIIFFVYLLVMVTCSKLLLSHDEECSALYQLKQSIFHQDSASFGDHRGFQKFDSWKITNNRSDNGSDCCLWDGVVCNKKEDDNYVIGLDLSKSFLRGPINSTSTLFNLVHLRMLNLSMNDFTESQIPSRIAHLKQLRILDLSYSGFTGQIPNEISQLIHLSSLDLSWNPLKLQIPSLDDLVKNVTRLEKLHLSGVEIRSSVPYFLANFSSLSSIKLTNCLLQNEFPTAILQLPKLKVLDVSVNTNLTGSFPEFYNSSLLEYLNLASTSFFGTVPESISNLNHLTFLRLTGCFFTGKIPDSLSNMTQLNALGLGHNEFTTLVPSLVRLSELNILELSGNKFENGRIPEWLGKLTKLSNLYINRNNIYDEIPPFLANLTKLNVVAMAGNSLFGHIPSSFFNLTQLSTIDLSQNQLQGPISRSFSNFESLQDFHLHENNFSGRVDLDMFRGLNDLESLLVGGNSISFVGTNNYTNDTLPNLKRLDLSWCNLKEYPDFLRSQHKMTTLLLNGNEIHGLVPEWIWNNSQETLKVIVLSDNFITGFHHHPRFLTWVGLEVFEIGYNQLQGWLPIPPPTTIIYDVSNNNLKGGIPPLICEVKSLQVLDFSSNNMDGTLPPCIGRLSNLKVLSLGDNSFEDVFPFWLETLAELQVLILRDNKFYGAIQGQTTHVNSQFPKLRIIDLSNNSFSGRLPGKYFETWNAMKSVYVGKSSFLQFQITFDGGAFEAKFPYSMTITNKGVKTEYARILNIFTAIDLSNNNFEGVIPESIQDLHGLESLNLSNNHLSGRVLSSLGNLKYLEALDLSRNKLSGEIPQQLLQLNFLAILNVSFNHLNGSIPQGKQFNTFENNSYMGNLGLCGKPLSKECQTSKVSTPSQTSNKSESSFLPSDRVDWIIIFSGVGSGLIVGIIIGNFLYTKYSYCLIERFGMRKGKWIRPLSNRRRNQVLQ